MSEYSADDGSESSPVIERADVTYSIDGDERPSEAVVRAVASLKNTPIIDLDPLYDVADPEHLDGLFERSEEDTLSTDTSIVFHYNGCAVAVTQAAVHVSDQTGDQ